MDSSLNHSRFSKADSQAFRSTGHSLVFNTVSRNTKPSWSNRIVKDVNDLTYNLDINLIGKNKFKSVTLEDRRTKNADNKKLKVSAREKRRSFFTDELMKLVKSARTFQFDSVQNRNDKNKPKSNRRRLSNLQKYGLSDYEYKNTINGKLQTKPNIHLKFDNQVDRKSPQIMSWYNPQLQIETGKMDQKRYRRVLQKYHPFGSYTDRKVFESKGKLDKIYQIADGKRKTSPNRIKRTVPIETVPGRKQDQINESSYLSYEITEAQKASMRSSPKYSIVRTPKKMVFTRQVINEKRGCFR